MQLKILSAGAAQGVVAKLGARFRDETECEIDGVFGGVNKIKAMVRRQCTRSLGPRASA